MIVMTRIDDRLIHGQVGFAWTRFTGASRIVVCDDDVANDEIQKIALGLATPPGVKLSILSVAATIEGLNGNLAKDKVLLLTKTPHTLLPVVKGVPELRTINVGGMRMSTGKRLISKAVAVDEADIAAFRELAELGVELEVRQVPTESAVPLFTLLK